MATRKATEDLIDDLHERGLRRKVAKSVVAAIGSGSHTTTPPEIARVADGLKDLADEIEGRATGRSAKRSAAARAVALIGVLAGCGDDEEAGATSTEQTIAAAPASSPTTEARAGTSAATAPAAPTGGAVTGDEAGAIAVARVGGTVETVEPEDEYGARWEVDVIAPDGEYTVYVSAAGEVVRVDGPFQD